MMTTTIDRPKESAAPERRWFLSLPTWIRAGAAETGGALSMIEQVVPPGFASPWHVHADEDESFYVVEGEMEVRVADQTVRLGAGGYAFGPRGVPHGFRIVGETPARFLLVTGGGRFAAFIAEASAPGEAPPAGEPDLPALVAAAARNGITILGPMPE
jgi:quercetin dioxygenase-like cupin family protein